jgi:hypothetical protein
MVVYIISTADGIKFDVPMLYGTLTRYLGTSKGIQCVIHVCAPMEIGDGNGRNANRPTLLPRSSNTRTRTGSPSRCS